VRVHRPKRRRQVDVHQDPARAHPPHQRHCDRLRQGHHDLRPRDPSTGRLPAVRGLLLRRQRGGRDRHDVSSVRRPRPRGV